MAIINGNEILFSSEINISDTLPQEKSVEATENGIVEVEPDEGYSLKKATVHVNVPIPENKLASLIDGSITEITAEDLEGVTEVADYAFYKRQNITKITIPDSVISIGKSAFSGCSHLEDFVIPNKVTSIGDSALYECGKIKEIVIPNSITQISQSMFAWCTALTSVDIPNSVESIGSSAFAYCRALKNITIPSSIKSIKGNTTFYDCPFERVDISDLAAWMAIDFEKGGCCPAWYSKGKLYLNGELITNLNLEDGITVSKYAFIGNQDIKSLVVGAVTIGNYAFQESGVETIDVGNATSIGAHAFDKCDNLTSINLKGTVDCLNTQTFYMCDSLINVTIPNNIIEIGNCCFQACYSLATARIGNGVTKITNAFANCNALTDIYIDKPEGSVTGAPWGAPNSPTIHWNTPLPTEED